MGHVADLSTAAVTETQSVGIRGLPEDPKKKASMLTPTRSRQLQSRGSKHAIALKSRVVRLSALLPRAHMLRPRV